jgi:MEMO1 family protein
MLKPGKAILYIFTILAISTAACSQQTKSPDNGILKEEPMMDRKPILAGSWYPSDPYELKNTIAQFFADANVPQFNGRIVGLVSPHAGYIYSGPVAAYAFKALSLHAEEYKGVTVIMVGPNHRTPNFSGITVWKEGSWLTPLGATQVDQPLAESLLTTLGPNGSFFPQLHQNEHSLEIMLPFLQYALGSDFKIVPIAFGMQSKNASEILANAITKVAKGKNVILLASTDLSHYLPEKTAHRLDKVFTDAVIAGDIASLNDKLDKEECSACGFGAVMTVMQASKALGSDSTKLLRYATSGDVPAGDSTQVVGYASIIFTDSKGEQMQNTDNTPDDEFKLTNEQKTYLLKLARKTIEDFVKTGKSEKPPAPDDPVLKESGAVFVTLHRDGNLRGCIGQMMAREPLYLSVIDMAIAAATEDYRFKPVSTAEFNKIDIEISVLSPMTPLDDWKKIKLGYHGVWLVNGGRSGVFLPQVGRETGWTLEYFLEELSSQKAGLSRNAYKDPNTKLFTFTVLEFDEKNMGIK